MWREDFGGEPKKEDCLEDLVADWRKMKADLK
jgi:hypothetical protein